MPKSNKTLNAQVKLVAAIAIWGGSFISTKIAVGIISPISVIWLRFLVGSIILGWFAYKNDDWRITSWREALDFVVLGFLGITINQWLQSAGLVTSEAATTAWILASTPVMMALLSWLFLKEKLNWAAAAGILMASLGVIMVVSKGDLRAAFSGGFGQPGDILILISAPIWAVYSILSCPVLERHSPIKVTFYTFLFGWLMSNVFFAFGAEWTPLNQIPAVGWLNVIYLGAFCSAFSYIFYNNSLRLLPTSQVAVFLNLEPLVATLVAAIVLDERIVPATLLGGAMILFGVWLVNRNSSSAQPNEAFPE
jgi:drug/metabolite transporter (DMT)-like permease